MKKLFQYLVTVLVVLLSSVMVSNAVVVDVSMQNFAFTPKNVTINAGDTVKWTNNESALHTTTSGTNCTPNGIWDSGQMGNGTSFQETFDTPGTYPYYCTFHCFSGMVGTVTVNASSTIPVPSSANSFTSPVITSPLLSTNASLAEPLGVGSVATGGSTLSLQLGLDQFAGPVDIYFLLYIPALDPLNIWEYTSTGVLQPISAGLVPLHQNVTGPISESIFGDIPTSVLPSGQYTFAILVTPTGDQSLTNYYIWVTTFPL